MAITSKKYKFITIIEDENYTVNGKPEYNIVNNKSKEALGRIYYFNRWKQYIFEGYFECVFSTDCLDAISGFMKKLNEDK